MSVPNAESHQVASGGDTKVDKRVCICGSALCSEIQGYLDEDDKRRGYIQIPPLPKENDGRRGAAKRLEALQFVYRRLKKHLNLSELPMDKRLYITRLHFPEERLAERKRRMIWYFKGARSDNRADIYKCADGSVITFNAPTVSYEAIQAIYDEEVQSDRKKRRLSRSPQRQAEEALQSVMDFATPVERNLFRRQSREDTRRVVQLSRAELAKAHDNEVRTLQNENAKLQQALDECQTLNSVLSSKVNRSTAETSTQKVFINGLLVRCGELEKKLEKKERVMQKQRDEMRSRMYGSRATGLSLANLLSDKWHARKRNKSATKRYFGFDTFLDFKLHADLYPDHKHCKKEYDAYVKQVESGQDAKSELKQYRIARWKKLEGVAVAMLRMRQGFQVKHLLNITGWGETKLRETLDYWIQEMGRVGRLMCNFPISVAFAELVKPEEWRDSPFNDCILIGDGKDCKIHKVSGNSHVRDELYSSKVSHSALRGMSWMLPFGLYCCVTDLVCARCSETELFKTYAARFDFIPATHRLLYDKGLGDMRYATKNLLSICTPSYLQKRDTFAVEETMGNRELARLRYGVEVGYSRVADFQFLQDTMHYSHGKHANSVWFYSHFFANMMKPLRV